MYTDGTAILYQTKRSQPTRRPGPGGTAGHQQPPPPPSAAAPPTEGGPCSGPAATRVRDWCHFSVGQFIPDSGYRPHTSPTDDHRITVRGRLSPGTRQTPQPPAEESDVPPPGRGPEAAHDESAAPPSSDTAASTGRCPAPLPSAMTASARPSPTAAPAAAASGDATTTGAGPGGAAPGRPAATAGRAAGWRRVPGRRGVQSQRRVPGSSLKQCSTDVIVIVKHTYSGKDALKVKHRAAKPMTMCLTQFSHYAYICKKIHYKSSSCHPVNLCCFFNVAMDYESWPDYHTIHGKM